MLEVRMTVTIPHVMILASAGSGKTRALALRFARLLLAGVDPQRITVLTFTRKAAGEFLHRIMAILASGARGDPLVLADFPAERPEPEDFLLCLQRLCKGLGTLQMGTLDSFFTRMVSTFSLELGMHDQLRVLEGAALEAAQADVLRQLVMRSDDLSALVGAFERSTFGEARVDVKGSLQRFVTQHHELFLECDPSLEWGNLRSIWPEPSIWEAEVELEVELDLLEQHEPDILYTHKGQRDYFPRFIAAMRDWRPSQPVPKKADKLYTAGLGQLEELLQGDTTFSIYKPFVIPDRVAQALARVICFITHHDLIRRFERVSGLKRVLDAYDACYARTLRSTGSIGFADLRLLLDPGRLPERELLDFRLDTSFDHWLLDEFQDTSRQQWRLIQNLVDEVIQDTSGQRTFFAVGDVKQAIYEFRGGDARLFDEVHEYYTANRPNHIERQTIETTYRLAQPLVHVVNSIFGAHDLLERHGLPAQTKVQWARSWRQHSAGANNSGYCQVHSLEDPETASDDESPLAEEDPLLKTIVERIHTIDPIQRALDCALLVRSNREVEDWVAKLRTAGIPASAEGKTTIATDNAPGQAIAALLTLAVHPGDRFARELLAMTHFSPLLGEQVLEFSTRTLQAVTDHGFERVIRGWVETLTTMLDRFNQRRVEQILAHAAEQDQAGLRSIDKFLDLFTRLTIPENSLPGTVQVMTIHKAKGLEFDIVFLPLIHPRRTEGLRGGTLLPVRDKDGRPTAVLELPRREVILADAKLRALDQEQAAQQALDTLSLQYVAFTRAKRELQIFLPAKAKDTVQTERFDFPAAIRAALQQIPFEVGSQTWWQDIPLCPAPLPTAARQKPDISQWPPRVGRRRPSDHRDGEPKVIVSWETASNEGAEFGTLVHAYFAMVEWGAKLPASDGVKPEVAAVVDKVLNTPEIAQAAFTQPDDAHLLLREAQFEWLSPSGWMTGAFDRVILRDPGRGNCKIDLFDFKTDRASPEEIVSAYANQIRAYREALAALCHVPLNSVRAYLIHCRAARLIALDAISPDKAE